MLLLEVSPLGLTMRTSPLDTDQTRALAARMDLPLPLEFFCHWAQRSKIFAWCSEGLTKHDINGHACVYPRRFEEFVSAKFHLKQRVPAARLQASWLTTCDLPLRVECYGPWAGRSQLRAWQADGLTIETINGHPCIHPDEFSQFIRDKWQLPNFGS